MKTGAVLAPVFIDPNYKPDSVSAYTDGNHLSWRIVTDMLFAALRDTAIPARPCTQIGI